MHAGWLSRAWVVPPIVITALISWQWRNFQLDDGLIYLRYVRNFVAGSGLYYNPGEAFNGLTSPLYTLLLTALSVVVGSPQVATILLSAAGLLAASLLGARLFSKDLVESTFTASLIASTGFFYRTYGMETTTLLALIAGTLHLARRQSPWVFPLAALAITTRNEAALLAIPVGIYYLYKTRKLPGIRYIALAVVVFVSPYIFNLAYYGAALPGTAAAKFGQGASGYWGESFAFLQVHYLLDMIFAGSLGAFAFMAAMTVLGIVVLRKDVAARLSWIYLGLLAALYLFTNMPNYHWYYAPFIYLFVLFAATGIASVIRAAVSRAPRTLPGRVALAALALIVATGSIFSISKIVSIEGQTRVESYTRIGVWLAENTAPTSSVALVEIGTVGWYSNRPIVDILGLVNDHNAEFIAHRDLYSWLYFYHPDYILCHAPLWVFEPSCDVLEKAGLYAAAPAFDEKGYKLLARVPGVTDSQITETVRAVRPK